MVMALNCIDAFPRLVLPARSKAIVPLEFVRTVGLLNVAPENVKFALFGQISVPADAKRFPSMFSVYPVAAVPIVAPAPIVVVPSMCIVPTPVVILPLTPAPTMRLPERLLVAFMFEYKPPSAIVTAAAVIVDALHKRLPLIEVAPAFVKANDDAAEVLRVVPALMVTAPNCIEALPRVEVPAALKDNNPLEWVKTVGLFQTAPAKVKAVAPVPDGATNVPADAKRLPVITSDVAVVIVTVALALMVVVPVIVFVPVLVVTAPLVPPPTMRLPAAVQLYVDVASVVPLLTVTE